LPLDALAAVLLDPAKVRAAGAGIELAPAALPLVPTLDWRERQPRVIVHDEDRPTLRLVLEAGALAGVTGFEQRLDGELRFIAGTPRGAAAERRELVLELDRPPPGTEREYRWRAIAADGLVSRALDLRLVAR
jgi:hypothetical protein